MESEIRNWPLFDATTPALRPPAAPCEKKNTKGNEKSKKREKVQLSYDHSGGFSPFSLSITHVSQDRTASARSWGWTVLNAAEVTGSH